MSGSVMHLGRRLAALAIGLGTTLVGALATAPPSFAAEQLYITYGILGRSIPVEDLRALADRGETTSQLRLYLRFANLDAEVLQRALNQEISVSPQLVDRITYSLPGEYLLFRTGDTIHTKSREANIQALRAALILSASDDRQVSLIEFLEKYPTPGVYVDGRSLARFAGDVGDVASRVQPVVAAVEGFLSDFICDCQTPASQAPASQAPSGPAGPASSLPEETRTSSEIVP